MSQLQKIAKASSQAQAPAADVTTLARPDTKAALGKIGKALRVRKVVKPEVKRALEILGKTKALLEQRGVWTQGRWYRVGKSQRGQFCLQGALRYVALGEPEVRSYRETDMDGMLSGQHHVMMADPGWRMAEETIARAVEGSIPTFNDHREGGGTSLKDVLAAITKAEKEIKKSA